MAAQPSWLVPASPEAAPDTPPSWLIPANPPKDEHPDWLIPAQGAKPAQDTHPDWLIPAKPAHDDSRLPDDSGIQATIRRTAQQVGVPESIALGVGKMESNYNPRAKSKAGALGVMQLMPDTAKGLGVDPNNPEQNILGGVKYLDQMYRRYGNWEQALAAYNAGPGAVDKAIRDVQFDEAKALRMSGATTQKKTWLDYLPDETKAYVRGLTPFIEGRAADRPAYQPPAPFKSGQALRAPLPTDMTQDQARRRAAEQAGRTYESGAVTAPNLGTAARGIGHALAFGEYAGKPGEPEATFVRDWIADPIMSMVGAPALPAAVGRIAEGLSPTQRAAAEAEAVARTLPAQRAARVIPGYAPGAIAPGARAAIEIEDTIRNYLAKTQDLRGYMGSIDETLRRTQLDKTAATLETNRMVQAVRGAPQEEAAAYRLFEHPDELPGAAPQARQIVNRLQPIKDATDRMKADLRAINPSMAPEVTPGPYIHRIAQDQPDTMLGKAKRALQSGRRFGGGNVLGAAKPSSFKKAEMQALIGDDGSRSVVHIGRRALTDAEKIAGADASRAMVTVFEDGQPARSFPYRATTRGKLLEQALRPYRQNVTKLRAAIQALRSSPATPERLQAMRDTLQQVALDLVKPSEEYSPAEARFIRQQSDRLRRVMTRLSAGQAQLPELEQALNETSAAIKRAVSSAPRKGEPVVQELARVRRGSRELWMPTGKVFRAVRATTDEIEAASGIRYYKSATASVVSDYVETLNKWRAVKTLEKLKTDPRFLKYATRDPAHAAADWKPTTLDQFRGWYMHPDVRAAFNRAKQEMDAGDDVTAVMGRLTNSYLTMVFLNPFAHTPNMLTQFGLYEAGRPWLWRAREWPAFFGSFGRAWNTALHMGEDYDTFLRAGANMMRVKQTMKPVADELLKAVGEKLESSPGVLGGFARTLGLNPVDIAKGLYQKVQEGTWLTHDFLTAVQTYQTMASDRVPMDEAIKRVSRFFVEYHIPTQAFGLPGAAGRVTSSLFRQRAWAMFGSWHYGALEALANALIKDPARALFTKMPMEERLLVAQRLLGLYALTVTIPDLYSKFGQRVTGSPLTYSPPAGSARFLGLGMDVASGKRTPSELMRAVVTPIPSALAAVSALSGRDWFTGKSIYDETSTPVQKMERLLEYLGVTSLSPYQNLLDRVRSGKLSLNEALLTAVHLYSPSVGAWGNRFYAIRDQIGGKQAQVNHLYATGHAADAQKLIRETNEAMFQALKNAAKDGGLQVNDGQLRLRIWGSKQVRGMGLHAPSPREIGLAGQHTQEQGKPGATLKHLLTPPPPPPHRGFGGLRI